MHGFTKLVNPATSVNAPAASPEVRDMIRDYLDQMARGYTRGFEFLRDELAHMFDYDLDLSPEDQKAIRVALYGKDS